MTVLSNRSAPPSTSIYNQKIPSSGYGYVTTRDGTKLALDVHLPAGATPGGGPYPTLFEYAGYGYADPFNGPDSGIAQIANLLGFAVVDVNMRGTGCSGGAYDYFEPLQGLDGYDVIETVARQPWVLHHKVGMIGVSYGGISQLFVAETQPPSLAAIAPLSVIDDSTTTLYAGGILNTGFTVPWIKDRVNDALPATATGGQSWALKQITDGHDATCKANQALHPSAVNLLAKVGRNRYYVPKVADPLSPITFVHKINVPVYLACQFTDEQTGGHCPDIASHFTGTTHKWFTFTNGVHTDSLDPLTFLRWYDFLELYVAQQAPNLSPILFAAGPTLYNAVLGVPNVQIPPDPLQGQAYGAALAAFQALPQVRVLFDNGAGGTAPGQPLPGFEQSFASFPIPGTTAQSWYLAPGGTLADAKPASAVADTFTVEPARGLDDRLHRQHRRRHGRPVERHAGLPLGQQPGRNRRLLRQCAAGPEHDRRRWRRGAGVDQGAGQGRRPPGHGLGGAARRARDVRTGRLAAGEQAQAQRQALDRARADPEPDAEGHGIAASEHVHRAHNPALLRGPRVPCGLADPGDDRGPERRAADLGVLADGAPRDDDRDRRVGCEHAVAARAAGRAQRVGADAAAALSGPARRAVPAVCGVDEYARLNAGPGARVCAHARPTALSGGVPVRDLPQAHGRVHPAGQLTRAAGGARAQGRVRTRLGVRPE